MIRLEKVNGNNVWDLLKLRVSSEEKVWSGSRRKLQQAQVRRCQTASVYAGERRGDNAGTQPFWGDLRKWDKQPDPNLIQRWLM